MITTAIATIAALLASATFIWVAAIVIIIAMAIFLEHEREGWATTFFSLGIALMLWNFRSEIWSFISSSPATTIGFAITYILIGIVWSFLKWTSYVKRIFTKFKQLKLDYTATNGPITDGNRQHFNEMVYLARFKNSDGGTVSSISSKASLEEISMKITPIASKKKSVITAWISYWPVSVTATLLNNPFRHFFEWIYNNLAGYYDKITNRYKKDAFGF